MKTFTFNIFNRIRHFTREINDTALFTKKRWILFDPTSTEKVVYIFKDNNELILAKDGIVSKGKWEYIDAKTILIDVDNTSHLLKHAFLDDSFLALKLDGRETFAVFLNENNSNTELNSIDAITQFLTEKYIDTPPLSQIKNVDFVTFKHIRGEPVTVSYEKFQKLIKKRDPDSYEILGYKSDGQEFTFN